MVNFKLPWLIACAIILSATIDVAQSKYTYKSVIQRSVSQNKIVATWQRAMEKCKKQGAILASPIDAEVLNVMKSYIDVNYHTSAYFIGVKAKHSPEVGSNDDDVKYVSVEGVDLDDMPDATLEMIDKIDPLEGDCLSMNAQYISAVPCDTRLPYICYTDITPSDNSTTETPKVVLINQACPPHSIRCSSQSDPGTSTSTSNKKSLIKEFSVPTLVIKGKEAELKCRVEEYGTDSSIAVKWFWIPRLAPENSMVLIYQRLAGQRPQAIQNSSPSKIKVERGHKDTHDNISLKYIKEASAGTYICQASTLTGEDEKRENLNVLNTK